ncbi:hypothetical protein GCM10009733_004630 [Nonomuraea maheshkhaliensis]|uniref:Uncharacterized protein n=1 Tax=Nonomuraea maheshkhaliensis TaxID=419590 RepID=A0ABN2EM38_9ACTN
MLLGGLDYDGALAERYGYVNRALPGGELDGFVEEFASRVASCSRQGCSSAVTSNATSRNGWPGPPTGRTPPAGGRTRDTSRPTVADGPPGDAAGSVVTAARGRVACQESQPWVRAFWAMRARAEAAATISTAARARPPSR